MAPLAPAVDISWPLVPGLEALPPDLGAGAGLVVSWRILIFRRVPFSCQFRMNVSECFPRRGDSIPGSGHEKGGSIASLESSGVNTLVESPPEMSLDLKSRGAP